MSDTFGHLLVTEQQIETGDGHFYRVITDAKLEGNPLVYIGRSMMYELPDWAIALDGALIQVGPYVLRRAGWHDPLMRADAYYVVDGGLPYALWWHMNQKLEYIWGGIILTLAVWGLGAWPREGVRPSWGDVMRRWRK